VSARTCTRHRSRTTVRRRLLIAAAGGAAIVGLVAPAAQADWACAAVGDPVDLGVCVDDPLPKRLPTPPKL
jgi:hypothetical protein